MAPGDRPARQPAQQELLLDPRWFATVEGEVRLMGARCDACGKVLFPAKPICPACASDRLAPVPLSRRGTLHSFARSLLGPAGIERPFVIAFVDLPERIKLYGLVTDCEPWDETLRVGMDMDVVVGRIARAEDGRALVAYSFRPVRSPGRGVTP